MPVLTQTNVPAEWVELWAKVVKWFGKGGIPVYVALWFQQTRSFYENQRQKSLLKDVSNCWKSIDAATKQQWKLAAYQAWHYYRSYRLFTADFIYRLKNNLPLPGQPNLFYQLFGLKISNPGGTQNIFMRRDDKDLVGRLRVRFNYKKIENTPSADFSFKILQTAYYFGQGTIETDTDEDIISAGNIDWTAFDKRIGTTNRKYFHYKLILSIENYDAEILIDNIRLADSNGEYYFESFNTINYAQWEPKFLYRKQDWQFSPGYGLPYFEHSFIK